MVRLLLDAGADPNARKNRGATPLIDASQENHRNPAVLETLIEGGADPNVFDDGQYSPLHWAASRSVSPDAIEVLIACGADPNARGVSGFSPLHMALENNVSVWGSPYEKWSIPAALIRGGADPNQQNLYGSTALHAAVVYFTSLAIYEILIEGGADTGIRNGDGRTPLRAMRQKKDQPETVAFLKVVEAAQNRRKAAGDGQSARWRRFNTAAFFRRAGVGDVRSCLRDGADPNARCGRGQTVLYNAAASADPAVIEALIEAGAEVDARNDCGNTPLHEAARVSSAPAVIEALIAAGADPDARNRIGATPLHKAAGRIPGTPSVIGVLARAGADADARTVDGYTPLLIAALNCRDPAVIEALLAAGADPDLQGGDDRTALHVALWYNVSVTGGSGRQGIPQALVRAGTDPNIQNDSDFTAMHMAAHWCQNPEIFAILMAAGADLGIRNRHGDTAFSDLSRNHPEVVEALGLSET